MFSLRIVNVDSYQSAPTKGYDICYSEFRGCEVFKVPIIRIFGITPAGQKGCLHVHGVFPYFSIRCKDVFPNIETKSLRKYIQELAMDIDKALNIASRNSNSRRQHVYKIVVTEHIPFYGFHEKAEEFLKIYFYNPFDISRTAELMTNGVILNKFIQPYEAHIPYILQFFIDYNLFGMNLINVSKFKFRASNDDLVSAVSPLRNQSLSHILDESISSSNKVWNIGTLSSSQISSLPRQTVCELEADCCSSEIMNRLNESFSCGKNPGLLAIWEEERQRRKAENDTSQFTPVPSQERADFIETESENFYKKKLRKVLESFDVFKVCQKEKIDHTLKDLEDLSSPNVSDLSSTQDEEMLNMMLSMVNSQSTQLDDDSILGLNHQNDLQSESVEDETLEMSQLFTGELEEMWNSQIMNSDTDKHRTNISTSTTIVSEQSVISNESNIPQIDGAFDEQGCKPGHKHPKKNKNTAKTINEESLIKSCNLLQPVVQLIPSVLIKTEVINPTESRLERETFSEFMDEEDSSLSNQTPKGNSFPICVPVSKNAHCSLIMNIYENSNDVSIEHTCATRNSAQFDCLADAEDPSNVVFEILTNLVYKVECLTEGKTSCYEHLTKEYKGESCSDILYQGLSTEEKNTLSEIKAAPSDFEDKSLLDKTENFSVSCLRLPIKKRIFRNDQCDSCSHSLSMDFSKIGKEVVVLQKLSESDLINNLNSLKVVIPPLPLHSVNTFTGTVRIDSDNFKSMLSNKKKDSKILSKKTLKSKNFNCDNSENSPKCEIKDCIEFKNDNFNSSAISQYQLASVVPTSKEISLNNLPTIDCENLIVTSVVECPEPLHISDHKLIFSHKNLKVTSHVADPVSTSQNIDNETITDSTDDVNLHNRDHKMNNDNTDHKIVEDNTVYKINEDNTDHKINEDDTDHKINDDITVHKISEYNTDHKINEDNTDHKINEGNTDHKINEDTTDHKINEDNTDHKINEDNTDHKINEDSTDHKVNEDNTDHKVSEDSTDHKINEDSTDHKIKEDNTDHKINEDNKCHKIILDITNNEISCSFDSETVKPRETSSEEKNFATMSELRLYRRKKLLLARDKQHQDNNVVNTELKIVFPDSYSDNCNSSTTSVGSRTKESSSHLQIKPVGIASKLIPDSACIPIVQLEPCKELIDKYCKNEGTDSDCLILGEVTSESKMLPAVKEKRFFRSRVRQLRDQNLSSRVVINHKLGINGSKFKSSRFLPNKKAKRNTTSNFSAQRTSGPVLRKRSANFESPDKKKLSHPNSKYTADKNSLDRKLEQVYDFESHLNADDYDLDNKSFSRYSLKNKYASSTLKKDVSCKLSLKLNRKNFDKTEKNLVPEYGISAISNSQCKSRPTRRASASVICYNEDHFQTQQENQFLTKRLRRNICKDRTMCENSVPNNMSAVATSNQNSDWSIDDIPISQLKTSQGLKCTISKKRLNNENSLHEVERLPIPKFKVRKKTGCNSLNVSIKLKRSSVDNENDFKIKKKSFRHASKRKKDSKTSRKSNQTFTSALGVKHKYKKCKESKNEGLKNAIWQYCNSVVKNKTPNPETCLKNNPQETVFWKKKLDFCKPNSPFLSSYNSNSTPKDEISDISNSSPFTEDNSDDSKRSKSSLKMKLKLKRILTRSNEERIVVVGKELEGIDIDSDENENKQTSRDLDNNQIIDKQKGCKKTLGTKGINNQLNEFKLKSKFKCPLKVEKKVETSVKNDEKLLNEEKNKFKEKIPKFKYKPLLANISKDLLAENKDKSVTSLETIVLPKSEHSLIIISPKKKSPLKNAESIKKELAHLNEMICTTSNYTRFDAFNTNLKNLTSEIPNNCQKPRSLSEEETDILIDDSHLSPTHSRLRERKQSTECKISSRRNSLRCQDFKKYFDSDNEDNALSVEVVSSNEKCEETLKCFVPDLFSTCKPCSVQLQRLSTFEVEKHVHKQFFNMHNSEEINVCEPLVASFPSPIVDSKSADSYIDPRKVFENLFEFSSPSQSPSNYNTLETSNLVIENEISVGPFSNESSEHSKKEIFKPTFNPQNPLKPNDVFKSVERKDMGVLWNLSYFSPPQISASEKSSNSPTSLAERKSKEIFNRKENSIELDELQKLASRANQLCSISFNFMESEGENSVSMLNEKSSAYSIKDNSCGKEAKISFENILEGNTSKVFEDLENVPSFSQTPTEFEVEHIMSNKSDNFEFPNTEEEIARVIKEEPKSDPEPIFEPMESLPNVRILDFQECLVESDSEMNPLLNDSEIDSVMSSADMILSNSIDTHNYEQCRPTDLSFEDSSLSIQNKHKCASEEPKNRVEDVFTKSNIDSSLQKELDGDLTCNNAIITAADTSSLLIPSYKSNTIPVLAINNPSQDGNVNFAAFEEQNFNASGQFFPVMLAPVPVAENTNYLENSATVVKESTSGPQECVNFLEDNELLQSCSVSSTSDIENKNTQASSALGIPFNGEEDILSMIVKSCDIGEEFDVNMNSVEETDSGSISSATLCNNLIDSNYVMSGSNFIISSQPDQNSFHTNSENAVSSSSENNLAQKKSEIVVIKTEPIDVPDMEQIVYEFQDKSYNLNHANKNVKTGELENEDNVLLDSMIHSFYGDDSLYGLQSSANSDNLSLLCPTFQNSNSFSQDVEKLASEYNSTSYRSSVVKTEDVILENCSYKSDSYFRNLSIPQVVNENDSLLLKNFTANDKVPSGILPNSSFVTHPLQKISPKRFHFTPSSRPPPRDLIETCVTKSEIDKDGKMNNATEGNSFTSDSSLDSPISTNDTELPNVFKKTSLNELECLGSQNFHCLTKNTPHYDVKAQINSPVLYQENNVSKFSFSANLISTPSTSNIKKEFPFPDVVVSPINKETGLIADTSKRKRRRLIFEDDSEGPQKMFKPGREKVHSLFNKYPKNSSINQSVDSLGNLSYSQIDGPTLENSRGFKVGSDNYGDARVRHEVQHLTVMSLEIHVNTRNDLRPDPKFDPITAIFYCIYNDIGNSDEEEIVGMIVVDPVSHHEASGQNSSETLKNYLLLCPGVKNGFIYVVENEILLFEKLVRVIKEWDPDILIGYEIQMSSWGYLVERAEILNINLRLLLSRLIDKNETKILPIEQDPTVTDQTADLSRLNIIGRIVLCVWRLIRKEVTLNVYSFENVYYHVLHKRTPLFAFHDLTNWFLGSQKEKVIRYYVIRVQGSVHLLEKLDIIGRTSELARLFGIQFYEVLSRGSQFRVESMMLRTAAPMTYIPVSPSIRQRSHSKAPECVPLILEPESRFYSDPIVVLDFQSLYPSMIIAYNYCFSTCLGRVEHFGKNVPFEFGCTSLSVPTTLLQKLQNGIHISPTGIAFVKSSVRRGILPSMLEEILNTRIMVKQSMKKVKDNNALKRLLDARQMGLKLIANVTYGYTGASFSGRMPSVEVADSIVGKGRETLERAIHMIENTSKWRAKVVYGDTDSLFILLPGRSKKQAFEIGQEIADAVTADNPKPVKLKFEKVYLPCILQTKKRYVGYMYETVDQEKPIFDAKGIETVRRDSCPATAKILEKSLKILFKSYDVALVQNYVQKQFSKLLSGQASIIDCIFAKEYRGISGYRPGACVPALEIAKKRLVKDPRSEPRVGERVPYVVVYGFPGLPIIQLVHEPIDLLRDLNLRINTSYYITRVISPPLERVFSILGADVKSWYTNLARTFKPTLPMTHTANQHRGTLSQYFVTLSCPSCEKPTFTTVCDECREDLQGTTITLNGKIRQWERTVDHLTQICGSCTKSGSSIDSCISLDCPMLFKLNAAKKDLSQAPYLRKVLAHELF